MQTASRLPLTREEAAADDLPQRLWITPVIAQEDEYDPDWQSAELACTDMKPEYFLGTARDLLIGQRICGVCSEKANCARDALETKPKKGQQVAPPGLRGGLTFDQRAWLRRGARWRWMLRRQRAEAEQLTLDEAGAA